MPVPKLWIARLGKSNGTTVGTRHAHCRRFRLFVASHLNSGFGDEVLRPPFGRRAARRNR